jgi:hypothetical protein
VELPRVTLLLYAVAVNILGVSTAQQTSGPYIYVWFNTFITFTIFNVLCTVHRRITDHARPFYQLQHPGRLKKITIELAMYKFCVSWVAPQKECQRAAVVGGGRQIYFLNTYRSLRGR